MTVAEANPVPVEPVDASRSVHVEHGTFRCRRGYDLYTTTYKPSKRRTSACLVFHHGLSDHAQRHSAVLSHLCSSLGMPVYTYDAHGHGRSGPPGPTNRNLIWSFDNMVNDLLDFTRHLVVPAEEKALAAQPLGDAEGGNGTHGQPRIFLLGYSMGGLTCCLAAASAMADPAQGCEGAGVGGASVCGAGKQGAAAGTAGTAAGQPNGCGGGVAHANGFDNGVHHHHHNHQHQASCNSGAAANGGGETSSGLYEGLMLTSGLTDPLYGNSLAVQLLKMAFVTLMSWLAPTTPFFKRNPVESGIRDPAAVAEMASDTLWYRGRFKPATVASLFRGCARLRRLAHRLAPLPLYVQHATVDVACSLGSMQAFLARVRPKQLEMHVVQGAYHDLHHDPETPVLLGRMVAWLAKRV